MSRRRRDARKWQQVTQEQRKAANRVEQACRTLFPDSVVSPSVSRTGGVALRCSTCGKVCFTDRAAAEEAVAKIPDPMVVYLAPCGFWHLSTVRDR